MSNAERSPEVCMERGSKVRNVQSFGARALEEPPRWVVVQVVGGYDTFALNATPVLHSEEAYKITLEAAASDQSKVAGQAPEVPLIPCVDYLPDDGEESMMRAATRIAHFVLAADAYNQTRS